MELKAGIAFAGTALAILTGCATQATVSSSAVHGAALHGRAHGGQQPVSGAAIQLYAASTGGDGTAATPLLTNPVQTGNDGGFDITSDYTCPSASTLVYLIARGGNPGLAGTYNVSTLSAMTALGACGNLSSSTFIQVDELTTVASVFPLAPFMQSYQSLGSGTADQNLLLNAFNQVNQLIDITDDAVPGPTLPTGAVAPVQTMDTLADILSACINSAGGKAGDSTPCGQLFAAATGQGQTAPTDVVGAAINIANQPAGNASTLFKLAPTDGPYQPVLQGAPASFAVSLQTNSPIALPESANLLGQYLMNEGQGSVAGDTSGLGHDASITGFLWEGATDLSNNLLTGGAGANNISFPAEVTPARTWMIAFYQPPFGTAVAPQAPGFGDPSQVGVPAILCGTTGNLPCFLSDDDIYSRKSFRFYAFGTDNTEAASGINSGWHVWTLICGSNVGGVVAKTHYLVDGQEVPAYSTQGDANTCGTAIQGGNFAIGGGSQSYGVASFFGKTAGAWAWSTQLSVSEASTAASAALAFITAKGVPTSYTPVSRSGPVLLAGLDSRTAGVYQTSVSLWVNAMSLTQNYTRIDLGYSGQTAYDECRGFGLMFPQQAGTGPVITVLWGAINDMLSTPASSTAQIATDLQCVVTQAKALGRVVLATEISGKNNGIVVDPQKDALDSLIRSQAFSWGVDDLADLASDPMIGADGAYANSNCFADGLHPTVACEPHITTILQDAVNELLGSSATNHNSTAASSYSEQAGDRYLDLTGTVSQTITLPDCLGYSLPRYIDNNGLSVAQLATVNSETLSGSNVVLPGAQATLTPVPADPSVGGCSWSRTQ